MSGRGKRWMALWIRLGGSIALILVVLGLEAVASPQDGGKPAKDKSEDTAKSKLGVIVNDARAFQGYTLLAPMQSTKTYLIDNSGKVVRTWESDIHPALSAYLLENGHLLRPGNVATKEGGGPKGDAKGGPKGGPKGGGPGGGGPGGPFPGGMAGAGGRVQEFTWDGELVWDFKFVNDKQLPHHDITRLPNGNVLLIVADKFTNKEVVAAGRRPDMVGDGGMRPDSLIEIKPTGKTTGEVVWEWHVWDHLVQEHDPEKANYGKVAEHPELVDINFGEDVVAPIAAAKGGMDKLKSIGYVGNGPRPGRNNPDWTHVNGVSFNADLNQIVMSVHNFSEIWIIDHSTTKAEAAGHKGGRSGHGGDLLYRWGNPRAYHMGKKPDQRLFAQHNAHWIPKGLTGAGHLLVFNNGNARPGGAYSSVDEIVLPVDSEGRYQRPPEAAFGPEKALWSYSAPKHSDFYAMLISGAQRLPNGNTLICSGPNGTVFEVTPEKDVVWKFVNPVKGGGPGMGGGPPGGKRGPGGPMMGGPPQPGRILPPFLHDMLALTEDQKKKYDELQTSADEGLAKIFTADQKKQFMAPSASGPAAFGGMPQPGKLMSPTQQASLKLTAEQKKDVTDLQKSIDDKLDTLLTKEQKQRLDEQRRMFAGGGFGRGGPGGGPGGPGGGPGGPGPSSLFRALRYGPDYPGLAGKELKPGKTLEELQPKENRGGKN